MNTKSPTARPATTENSGAKPERMAGRDSMIPASDVVEDVESAIIEVDLPGVAQDDVDIELDNGTLTVTGHYERQNSGGKSLLKEFESAKYFRSFRLGDGLDVSNAEATFQSGVLTVRIPRRAVESPKRIEISSRS